MSSFNPSNASEWTFNNWCTTIFSFCLKTSWSSWIVFPLEPDRVCFSRLSDWINPTFWLDNHYLKWYTCLFKENKSVLLNEWGVIIMVYYFTLFATSPCQYTKSLRTTCSRYFSFMSCSFIPHCYLFSFLSLICALSLHFLPSVRASMLINNILCRESPVCFCTECPPLTGQLLLALYSTRESWSIFLHSSLLFFYALVCLKWKGRRAILGW